MFEPLNPRVVGGHQDGDQWFILHSNHFFTNAFPLGIRPPIVAPDPLLVVDPFAFRKGATHALAKTGPAFVLQHCEYGTKGVEQAALDQYSSAHRVDEVIDATAFSGVL